MKKRFPVLMIGCIVLVGLGCIFVFTGIIKNGTTNTAKNSTTRNNSFVVNGKQKASDNVIFHEDYVELPLTEVLDGFGAIVEWIDNNTANITYLDKVYVLSLQDMSLIEKGKTWNLLDCPPGSTHYHCNVNGKEVFLDNYTIKVVMYLMGKYINVNIDRVKSNVFVTKRS